MTASAERNPMNYDLIIRLVGTAAVVALFVMAWPILRSWKD